MNNTFSYSVAETEMPMSELGDLLTRLKYLNDLIEAIVRKEARVDYTSKPISALRSEVRDNGVNVLIIDNDLIPLNKLSPYTDNLSTLELLLFNLKRTEISNGLNLDLNKQATELYYSKGILGRSWLRLIGAYPQTPVDLFDSEEVVRRALEYMDIVKVLHSKEMFAMVCQSIMDSLGHELVVKSADHSAIESYLKDEDAISLSVPVSMCNIVIPLKFYDARWYTDAVKAGTILNKRLMELKDINECHVKLHSSFIDSMVIHKEKARVVNGYVDRAKSLLEAAMQDEEINLGAANVK